MCLCHAGAPLKPAVVVRWQGKTVFWLSLSYSTIVLGLSIKVPRLNQHLMLENAVEVECQMQFQI